MLVPMNMGLLNPEVRFVGSQWRSKESVCTKICACKLASKDKVIRYGSPFHPIINGQRHLSFTQRLRYVLRCSATMFILNSSHAEEFYAKVPKIPMVLDLAIGYRSHPCLL